MNIYEVLVYSILISFLLFSRKTTEKFLFNIFVVVLIIIAAFRGLYIGTDTQSYYYTFMHDEKSIDLLFDSWGMFCHKWLNYDWYMFLTYSYIIGMFTYLSKKKSPLALFSLFIFVSCEFYLASFNAFRQYISAATIFLIIYILDSNLENKRKIIYATILVIANTFIHHSSLVVLLLFILLPFKINKSIQSISVIASFLIGFFFTSYLMPYFNVLAPFLGDLGSYLTRDIEDGSRNLISNLGLNVVFLFTLFLANSKTTNTLFFKSYFLSVIIFNVVGNFHWLTRLTDNFALSQLVVFPVVYDGCNKKMHKFIYLALIIIYCLSRFYLKGISNPDVLPYNMREIDLFTLY